ncbi:MAG: type IV secretion system DNA-binding domain-containing protein [Verrucomicrobiota bacterium]
MNLHQRIAENFHSWERRGRGAELYCAPVELEPPFVPFPGHRLRPADPDADTGKVPGLFDRLSDRIFRALQPPRPGPAREEESESMEEEPCFLEDDEPLVELRLLLPPDLSPSPAEMANFLTSLSHLSGPLALELTATGHELAVQLTVRESDAPIVTAQFGGHFPEIMVQASDSLLAGIWEEDADMERMVIEFGLGREFMYPLAPDARNDPFVGLLSAMGNLEDGEAAVYQVLFTPLSGPWDDQLIPSVSRADGKPLFDDGAALLKGAQRKVSSPLFGCVTRLAARSPDTDRMWDVLRHMAAPLRLFADRDGNHLRPLPNDGYDIREHCGDLLLRRSRRCGMILNREELLGFVRFPSRTVKSPKLRRLSGNTREAPPLPKDEHSVFLGLNEHAGKTREVWLTREQRVRHFHILGGTGTGKSTLLFDMMRQDLENGRGFALLDPHGDLADRVMGAVPAGRVGDVVVLDPSDEEYSVPFNILSAHSDSEKTLLSSDLVSVFQRLSTSWGDQMNSVFRNAVLAFLESSEGGTMAGLRRFLLEPKWRNRFLETVTDPDVVYYWKQAFPQLGSNKSIGPVITRLETFLSPKPIRYMVSQKENRVDLGEIMDGGKILIARLPQGQMGAENSFLMGSLVVSKLQQMTMRRQRQEAAGRRDFFCYIDEAHHFLTPSMKEILSGARKYRLGLVMAHQELRQLERDREVASAVSNAGTRIVFRVGDADARALAEGFVHFGAADIQNLRTGQAICRVEGASSDFNLVIPAPQEPEKEEMDRRREEVLARSRETYGTPRAEVEASLREWMTEEGAGRAKEGPAPVKTGSPPPPAEAAGSPVPPPAVPSASENAAPPATEGPAAEAPPPAPEPEPSPGRGGPVHKALQRQVVAAANAAGLKAFPECDILEGKYRLDVSVEGTDFKTACEVVVTSRTRKEIETLRACLSSGYQSALLVCSDPAKLASAEAETAASLPDHDVQCILPVQIAGFLKNLARAAGRGTAPAAEPERFANHDITRSAPKLTPAERRRREHEMLKIIAEAIRGDIPHDQS